MASERFVNEEIKGENEEMEEMKEEYSKKL